MKPATGLRPANIRVANESAEPFPPDPDIC